MIVETQMEYIGLRVNVDKNVDSSIEAHAYIPAAVPALGVRPVDMLRDYLLRFRPPSGGYLLAAPRTQGLGSATFHPGLYTCLGRAYRTAYLRAFPDASTRSADMSRVSAHSGRKSLSQWLWDAYQSVRLIADAGGVRRMPFICTSSLRLQQSCAALQPCDFRLRLRQVRVE